MKLTIGEAYVVEWEDITSYLPHDEIGMGTWLKEGILDLIESTICLTVGILIKETHKFVALAMSINDQDNYGVIKVIPKGVIIDIARLREDEGKDRAIVSRLEEENSDTTQPPGEVCPP